jgi:hypothetical protein
MSRDARLRCWLVEDSPRTRSVNLVSLLAVDMIEPVQARNAAEASKAYRLLFLDIHMIAIFSTHLRPTSFKPANIRPR